MDVIPANAPPTINLSQPSNNATVCQNDSVLIQWTDSDPDNNAYINLARDTDNDPQNGSGHTWLALTLPEDPDGSGDQYSWDTSGVPEGTYYIWGMIYDAVNPEVYDVAPGNVTIQECNSPPTIDLSLPSADMTVSQGDSVLIQWTDSDPDNNAYINLARDTDNDPQNGSGHTWLALTLPEDPDGSGDQYSWDTSGVPEGTYYIWGMIYDAVNPEVYDVAPGRVAITIGTPDIDVQPASLSFTREETAATSESILGFHIPESIREYKYQSIYDLLEVQDRVRVIVHLKSPLRNLQETSLSIDELAVSTRQLQDTVLGRLTVDDFIPTNKFLLTSGFAGEVSRQGLDKLISMPEVAVVYENLPTKVSLGESVPLINADDVHNLGITGDGITVAVLDTGIDPDHPDLSDDLVAEHCFTQSACPPNNTNESSQADDGNGHGTSVSGIISSNGSVAPQGVAPDAGIVAVKVMNDSGTGSVADWIEGIDWVVANQATFDISIINMSVSTGILYTNTCDTAQPGLATAVNIAVANGIAVFAASGNNGSGAQMSAPACLSNVIAVGAVYDANVGGSPNFCLNSTCTQTCRDATTSADMVTCFSNSNNLLNIMAPSYENRTSDLNGGETTDFGGTSAASPHAAATAALILELNPGLDPATIMTRLEETGDPVTDTKNSLTFPRIDALAAIQQSGVLVVDNLGDANLQVNDISIVNNSCWLNVPPPNSFTVAPGDSETVMVNVEEACVAVGTYSDTIRIRSNDPDEDPFDVPVELEVLETPRPDLVVSQPQPSAFPPFYVEQNIDWGVTTTNQGNGDAQATRVGYYLGVSCSDMTNQVNSDPVDPLISGAFEDDNDTYIFRPEDVGTNRYLISWADYLNEEPNESNEDNNTNCYGPFEVLQTHHLTVTVAPDGGGSVSVDPPPNAVGGKYVTGTQVVLTATATPTYIFSHWTGDALGSTNPMTITMGSDKMVAANYVSSTTCTVTIAADSGPGSLRQCILDAQSGDVITFDPSVFPPASPATISLTSPLPDIITSGLTIDGSSTGVILDGSGTPGGTNGLALNAVSNVTIRGLYVLDFPATGIVLYNGASDNTIGGTNATLGGPCSGDCNLISGNGDNGVDIEGSGTVSNTIQGNYIGTNVTGTLAISNGLGINIHSNAAYNIIQDNLISGNAGVGIFIGGTGTIGNLILSNYIGTDASGTTAVGNAAGVNLGSGASLNTIGDNLISGNNNLGINIINIGTENNVIQGNLIGTNLSGTTALANGDNGISLNVGASNNLIGGLNATPGGACSGDCNLISGNNGSGIEVEASGTTSNTISGNYIGTDINGTAVISNAGSGLLLISSANYNLIGGSTPGERNLISGNSFGIEINGATEYNLIRGNYIGTNAAGTAALGNEHGIGLSSGAANNTVGGSDPGQGNLISGNEQYGLNIWSAAQDNTIIGNLIGTNANGSASLGNGYQGIGIWDGANGNRVGGNSAGERNVISGNGQWGIQLADSGTISNTVVGNYIGTDASGTGAVPNTWDGVAIHNGAQFNIIGGNSPAEQNTISGNNQNGIRIWDTNTASNTVLGNVIGTDAAGTAALANQEDGIYIESAADNLIGPGNTVGFNNGNGIQVNGPTAIRNTISENSIHTNNSLGIFLTNGGNAGIAAPIITSYDPALGTASGTACPLCIVEVFSDGADEGRWFEGSTNADGGGNWSLNTGGPFSGPNVTATATDAAGNTSQFGTTGAPPTSVLLLSIARVGSDIQLSWTDNPTNLSYQVHRSPTPFFSPDAATLLATLPSGSNAYTDTGAAGGTALNYFYTLRAFQAGNTLPPSHDTFVDLNLPSTNFDDQRLELTYSNFPAFSATRWSLLRFDLSAITNPADRSLLVLELVENNLPAGASVDLALYSVADDAWDESTLTQASAPAPGTLLQTMTINAGFSGGVQFGDPTASHPVGDYIEAERTGDRTVSFLLRLDGGSGSLGFGGSLLAEDREGSTDGINGNEPFIDVLPGPSTDSNQVGEIDYPLNNSGGGYSLVTVPFSGTAIVDASSLAGAIGDVGAVLKWNPATQAFRFFVPPATGDNFPLSPGEIAFVQVNNGGPSVMTVVGEVISVQHSLVPGGFNFISLPLQRADLTDAAATAADITNVNSMLRWNDATQTFRFFVPPSTGDNFPLMPGTPFVVDLAPSGPSLWP